MNIMILEDNEHELTDLRFMVENYLIEHHHNNFHVFAFSDSYSFLTDFPRINPDLAFIDIFLSGAEEGVKVAQAIYQQNPQCALVFTTSSREFALEGFQVNALHYCVKPITEQMIDECFRRCLERLDLEHRTITVRAGRELCELRLDSIVYVHCDDHYLEFFLTGRDTPIIARLSMAEATELLSDKRFLRANRSFFINMDFVESIGQNEFLLQGDVQIPMRRQDRAALREHYHNYLFGKMRVDE
ncbi:MAG: LytTR family DNA-binding domain-containing protein [Succinivibrionaceae bacterium]|nr:LytTR family DNA-binding domain-containing protein [Succinivibrionaceae bacterium]